MQEVNFFLQYVRHLHCKRAGGKAVELGGGKRQEDGHAVFGMSMALWAGCRRQTYGRHRIRSQHFL